MASSDNVDYMTIGAFALSSGLTIDALRHYHDISLLVPDEIDRVTGYRRYSHDQVRRAQAIRDLRSTDMGIEQISEILGGWEAYGGE